METEKRPNKISQRLQGDDLADEAFSWIKKNPVSAAILDQIHVNNELLAAASGYGPLSDLVAALRVPSWADKIHMRSGSAFFLKYTSDILAMLGLYSLPYCYAGANGVRVLYLSKKTREEPERRLFETARFVFDVCENEAFSEQGKGLVAILKVRLRHAAARYHVKENITDEIPVNQEDMLGTMLAFSLIVIRGMRKTGIPIDGKEADAYLHLWTVIGNLMGIKKSYLPENIRQASIAEKKIRKREFAYSEEADELTEVLIGYITSQTSGFAVLRPVDLMSYLLGEEVAACVGIRSASRLHLGTVEIGGRIRNWLSLFSKRNDTLITNQFTIRERKVKMQSI